jgi:hypothetical protein
MMTPQEQEHMDHVLGSASEFQNCYQESQIKHSSRESETSRKIRALNDLGMHVVVGKTPAHCGVTDAIVGEHTSILGALPFDFAAVAFIGFYLDKTGYDPEEHVDVISPQPESPAEEAESHGIDMDDDCPF